MDTNQTRRIAVIDLGSNTTRLIIMETRLGFSYRLVDEVREMTRLRQGLTSQGLSKKVIARGLSTLRLYIDFCKQTKVDQVLATATSAVRDAANGPAFLKKIKKELGLSIQLLDSDKEAYYDTLGALNEVELQQGVVLDIGGGSIQLSQVKNRSFTKGASLPLGALALTDLFITSDPLSSKDFEKINQEITRQLDTINWLSEKKGEPLVGLGGTIRNLALIEATRQKYPFTRSMDLSLSEVQL